MAGHRLPGWTSVDHDVERSSELRTAWSVVPPDTSLLVATVAGTTDARSSVQAEFGVRELDGVRPLQTVTLSPADDTAGTTDRFRALAPTARDLRVDPSVVAPGADAVRLVAVDAGPRERLGLAVSPPRAPQTVPAVEILRPGAPAAYDWPTAFLFPCTPFSPLRDGLAPIPGWRLANPAADESRSGYISYTASQGGPWTTSRLLVRQERVPVYMQGLLLTDVIGLYRWVPVQPLVPPAEGRRIVTEPGWSSPGPLTIGR